MVVIHMAPSQQSMFSSPSCMLENILMHIQEKQPFSDELRARLRSVIASGLGVRMGVWVGLQWLKQADVPGGL